MAKKHKGLPHGVSYAKALAAEKKKKDLIAKAEKETEMRINAEIACQRVLWIAAVSIADAYGFGAKRLEPYFAKLKENSEAFDRMCEEADYDYALEKLRQKVEAVTGSKVTYLYEKELNEIQKRGAG